MIYQSNIVTMTESVFDKMEYSMIDTIGTVREYHGEYVLGGLFLGLTHPSIGWAQLSGLFSLCRGFVGHDQSHLRRTGAGSHAR